MFSTVFGSGTNPSSPALTHMRGLVLGLFPFFLLLVSSPAVADTDVHAGLMGMNSTWTEATESPISGHIMFGVFPAVPYGQSATFTITKPDGTVNTFSGSCAWVNGRFGYFLPCMFTGGQFDGSWTVSCTVHYGPSGTQSFGPTTFTMKNLSVGSMGVGGAGMDQDEVFACTAVQSLVTMFSVALLDGYEVVPAGAQPDPRIVHVQCMLKSLAGGQAVQGEVTGEAPALFQTSPRPLQPGLYYMDVSAVEQMLMWTSGGPDSAVAYSSRLGISSATVNGFVGEGLRSGHLRVRLQTSMSPTWVRATASLGRVRLPDGTSASVTVDRPATSDDTVDTGTVSYPLAGQYDYGITLKDSGGNMHDWAYRWATPKPVPFSIPATVQFWGPASNLGTYPQDTAAEGYQELGDVRTPVSGGGESITFYSGPPFPEDDGNGGTTVVAGGVVSTAASGPNDGALGLFKTALAQYPIIGYAGHSDWFYWMDHDELGNPICYVKYGIAFPMAQNPQTVWSQDIAGLPARQGAKAKLVTLLACCLLQSGRGHPWGVGEKPPDVTTDTFAVCGPVFAEEIASKYSGAVIAASDEVKAYAFLAFAQAFWARATKKTLSTDQSTWVYMNLQEAFAATMQDLHDYYRGDFDATGLGTVQLIGSTQSASLRPAF